MSAADRRFRRRVLRVAVALAALVVLIAASRWLLAGRPATGDARWIWAEVADPSKLEPLAFFAVRDFALDAAPGTTGGARLLIEAEEEYRAWINGRAVGSGVFRQGASLDVYEVGELLLAGDNRLLVELRSSFGGGGLLAALEIGDAAAPRRAVVSDGEWRIVRAWDAGLAGGWSDIAGAERAREWGRPPVGRWGVPEPSPPRPALALVGERPGLLELEPASRSARAEIEVEAAWKLPVAGYLTLELDPGSARLGVVSSAESAPVQVVAAPGASRWVDAAPRVWTRATVYGLDGVRGVSVARLPAELGEPGEPPGLEPLLGIRVPAPRTPLMQRVRRALGEAD